jgi:hypothetical protein
MHLKEELIHIYQLYLIIIFFFFVIKSLNFIFISISLNSFFNLIISSIIVISNAFAPQHHEYMQNNVQHKLNLYGLIHHTTNMLNLYSRLTEDMDQNVVKAKI